MLRERDDTGSLQAAAAADQDERLLTRRRSPRGGPRRTHGTLGALGLLGLAAIVVGVWLIAVGAAGAPGTLVPGRSGGWPGWLSGPLQGLGGRLGTDGYQTWTLLICAGYATVLLTVAELSGRAIVAAIALANLGLLLGPPLISQDVFGYLAFARLGVVHGLDPYTHVAAEAPVDAIFPFIGWPFQHSPYGPLFTLGTYPLALLGLGGGLWALKAVAALASGAAVALTAHAARRMGRSPKRAAAFVGLNPVLLLLAVGGAHNDTLVLLALAGALALMASTRGGYAAEGGAPSAAPPPAHTYTSVTPASPDSAHSPPLHRQHCHHQRHRRKQLRPHPAKRARPTAALLALTAGVGVKASAALVMPFLVLAPPTGRERLRYALAALVGVAALALVAVLGFGPHAFGFVDAISEQQQLVATHSIPQETARWLGMSALPGWWRDLFSAVFVAVLALTLWRTARGADWRTMAGWATLALLLCTAWLLPWYAIWALPLAALGDSRRLRVATLAVCAYAILIHLPLAEPVLSPPRHSIAGQRGAPDHRAGGGPVGHDVVLARLEVRGYTAFDLLG